jgi:hypothetical protein
VATALQFYYSRFGSYPGPGSAINDMACVGYKTGTTCFAAGHPYNPTGLVGDTVFNDKIKLFLPPIYAVMKDPVYGTVSNVKNNYAGFSYGGFTCDNPTLSCQSVELIWFLEGQSQDCNIGYRYSCGTDPNTATINNVYNVTQCRIHLPQRSTDSNSC